MQGHYHDFDLVGVREDHPPQIPTVPNLSAIPRFSKFISSMHVQQQRTVKVETNQSLYFLKNRELHFPSTQTP